MIAPHPAERHETVNVPPGDHFVTTRADVVITTVLGSCVAACIRDPVALVGGLNHFMLPSSESGVWGGTAGSRRFGNFAMESLINDILKRGGRRSRLEVKVFGGGDLLGVSAPIGHLNADFVEWYLRAEGMPIAASQMRGHAARQVRYFPITGRALVKELGMREVKTPLAEELAYHSKIVTAPVETDIELFG
jgi:chemotaxis protein CheD